MSESSGGAGRPPTGYVGSGPQGTLTREDARQLLEEWAASGKALTVFGAEKGMSGSRLGWWRTKFARERREGSGGASGPSFVPVVTRAAEATPAASSHLELVLEGGRMIRVPGGFDEGALRRLIAILEAVRPC